MIQCVMEKAGAKEELDLLTMALWPCDSFTKLTIFLNE
jgi:hypothetical protein